MQAEAICTKYRRLLCCRARPKSFVGRKPWGFCLFTSGQRQALFHPRSGRNRYQLLDVTDLCQAVVLVAEGPEEQSMMCSTLAPCSSAPALEFQRAGRGGYGRV